MFVRARGRELSDRETERALTLSLRERERNVYNLFETERRQKGGKGL